MGPRKLAAADRVGSAWNDVRGPEGDFSVYESGSIRVAVARLPTFQRVVHTRRPQGMPILRQVSRRSFTRGNAFSNRFSAKIHLVHIGGGGEGRSSESNAIESAINSYTIWRKRITI